MNQSAEGAPLDPLSSRPSSGELNVMLNKCRGRIESLYVFLDEGFLASEDQLSYLAGAYAALEQVQEVLSGEVESPLGFSISKAWTAAEAALTRAREARRAARRARSRRGRNA